MARNYKTTLALGTALTVIALAVFVSLLNGPIVANGSGFETYSFKAVTSTNASATAPYVIRKGAGTLGSITVGSTSAAQIRVYDGTTATSTGTLIATLKASVAEQTFVFDADVSTGIILDVPAAHNGVLTVTYK